MALQKQTVDVPIFGGLEEKTNPSLLRPGQSHILTNAILDETGAIKKRTGFNSLSLAVSGGSNVAGGTNCYGFDKQLLMQGTEELYEYSPARGSWMDRKRLLPVSTTVYDGISTSSAYTSNPVVAKNGNYICWGYCQELLNGFPVFLLQDYITRESIGGGSVGIIGASGVNVRIFPINTSGGGTRFFFVFTESGALGAQSIWTGILDPTAATIVQPTTVLVVADGAACDSCATTPTAVCLAYYSAATAGVIHLTLYDATNTATVTTTFAGTAVTNCIAVQYITLGSTSYICVAWFDTATNNLRYTLRNPTTLAQVLAPTTFAGPFVAPFPCRVTCAADLTGGTNGVFLMWDIIDPALSPALALTSGKKMDIFGGVLLSLVTLPDCALMSKAYTYNFRAMVDVIYNDPAQPTIYMVSQPFSLTATRGTYDAKFMQNQAVAITTTALGFGRPLPDVVPIASSEFLVPALRADAFAVAADATGDPSTRKSIVGIQRNVAATGLPRATLGENRLISTGSLMIIEGAGGRNGGAVELGFNHFPPIISIAQSIAAGALTLLGAYGFAIVYEYVDAAGNIQRSAPSFTSFTLTGANNTITITTRPYRMTHKFTSVVIATYRTVANGTVYYKTKEATNNPASNPTITSIEADSAITSNEILYTDGGILEDVAPPQPKAIAVGAGRIFAISSDDPTQIWYTKPTAPGLAPQFANELISKTTEGGAAVAMVEMDGNIIVWKAQQIRVFGGDGPNALGIGTFSSERRVAESIGCISPASVVKVDNGAYFQGHRGLWFIDRSLQVNYIGAPVESEVSLPIVAALSPRDSNRVYFLAGVSTVLAHDTFHGMWFTWLVNTSLSDLCEVDGVLSILGGNSVLQQQPSIWVEFGSISFSMTVATGWFNMAGIQGYQRLYSIGLMLDVKTHCTVRVTIYQDYDASTAVETININTNTAGATLGKAFAVRIKPQVQKCRSIMLKVEDVSGTGTEENVKWTALAYTVGVIGEIGRLSAVRSF